MPLQNRVTPFGDIVAIAQRGLFTGNRGIIHDPATKTLLRKRWSNKAWIVCALTYKNHHREVMAQRSWTELFFLDEAIALAAGHRPCFACRRAEAEKFRAAWSSGMRVARASAPEMDAVLHRERLDGQGKRIHALPMAIDQLPDGAVVACGEQAFTMFRGRAFGWTKRGYDAPRKLRDAEGLITPPSILRAIVAGYRPTLHPALDT